MSPLARHALGIASASAAPVVVLWGIASLLTEHPVQSFSDLPIVGGWLFLIAGVWAVAAGIPSAAILIRCRRTSAWYFALAGFIGGALPSAVALVVGEQFPPFDGTARSWLHVAYSSSMFGGLGLVGGIAYWSVALRGRVLTIGSSNAGAHLR
jgi:hypothetical protein